MLHVDPSACLYIGDLPADAIAAEEAGARFLGASYGWGITGRTKTFDTVGSIKEIEAKLAAVYAAV